MADLDYAPVKPGAYSGRTKQGKGTEVIIRR
jgi:hypothetical protein